MHKIISTQNSDFHLATIGKEKIKELKTFIDIIVGDLNLSSAMAHSLKSPITFFGSARLRDETSKWYKDARVMAGLLAKNGHMILTGGGPGMMQAANQGAYEECKLKGGIGNPGLSVGFGIKLGNEQRFNDYVMLQLLHKYFATRKLALTLNSSGFIYMPGGYGTLDELFEVLSVIDRVKTMKVPVVLYGEKYYRQLYKLLEKIEKFGLLRRPLTEMVTLLNRPKEVVDYIESRQNPDNERISIDINETSNLLTTALMDLHQKRFKLGIAIIGSSIEKKTSCKNVYRAGTLSDQLFELGFSAIFRGRQQISDAISDAYILPAGTSTKGKPQAISLDSYLPNCHSLVTPKAETSGMETVHMFLQKLILGKTAQGYVFFPGGPSVLNIFFEALCSLQTKKIPPAPIVLMNADFWKPIKSFSKDVLVKNGTINQDDIKLFKIVDNPDDVAPQIMKFFRKDNQPHSVKL